MVLSCQVQSQPEINITLSFSLPSNRECTRSEVHSRSVFSTARFHSLQTCIIAKVMQAWRNQRTTNRMCMTFKIRSFSTLFLWLCFAELNPCQPRHFHWPDTFVFCAPLSSEYKWFVQATLTSLIALGVNSQVWASKFERVIFISGCYCNYFHY